MLSFGIDTVQAHNRFATRLLPADNTLFKVSPEIHCSGVCSSYCCYGMQSNIRLWKRWQNAQLILNFTKLFIIVDWELNKVSLSAKIISERRDLVKLRHINRNDPAFLRHTVVATRFDILNTKVRDFKK